MELYHPALRLILTYGVDSVDISRVPDEQQRKLLMRAGRIFMHRNNYKEAAKAFAKAEDKESLMENTKWFLEQRKPHIAALFVVHIPKKDLQERAARECIETGHLEEAAMLYEHLQDIPMIRFIYENLKQPATTH